MKRRFGFTLAEVLITLGIIGVVAAMTIPTLIANTNSARFRSQFKKTLSSLSQAGLMAQAQYDIDYSSNGVVGNDAEPCAANANPEEANNFTFCAIFNGTLTGHVLSTSAPQDKNGHAYANVSYTHPQDTRYLTLSDGALVVFNGKAGGCHRDIDESIEDYVAEHPTCVGFIDVNGTTLPNRAVSCANAQDGANAAAIASDIVSSGENINDICQVPNDASHMRDTFAVAFHDATVEPITRAGRYVLTTAK